MGMAICERGKIMNKQEAIEEIKNIDKLNINDMITNQKVDMVIKNQILDIISQINEPQKVVVPQYVAEWIESQKESFLDSSAIDMYDNLTLDNNGGYYHEVWLWVIANHYDFIKAWHDGYTVEKEKRYIVKLKNKNGDDDYLVYANFDDFHFYGKIYTQNRIHTRKELESNGFGWVFDCEGIEVEEVE